MCGVFRGRVCGDVDDIVRCECDNNIQYDMMLCVCVRVKVCVCCVAAQHAHTTVSVLCVVMTQHTIYITYMYRRVMQHVAPDSSAN